MDRQLVESADPGAFERRVLAMAVGLTPQVVTETIYALAVRRNPPWVPTEIWLMTTAEGAQRARLTLLDPISGRFHGLCKDYGLQDRIRFDHDHVVVIDGPAGTLSDIRTPEDNAWAADAITSMIRKLCADPTAAVHASIAGGRKSMGYYMGYALSLFGRPQDRLSHVLVNEPFEGMRDFFFPPREPQVMYGAKDRPASTIDAEVQLAEIPFVRLRDGLPSELLTGPATFVETVEATSRRLAPARLRFDSATSSVEAGGRIVTLPPLLWAWYALLAQAKLRGQGEEGMVRPADLAPSSLLAWHRAVTGPMSLYGVKLETQLVKEGEIPESFFREKSAKLNRELRATLGLDAGRYLVQSTGKRPFTRHGLALNAEQIELPVA